MAGIRLLVSECEVDDMLRSNIKGYDKLSPVECAAVKLPYINTGCCKQAVKPWL